MSTSFYVKTEPNVIIYTPATKKKGGGYDCFSSVRLHVCPNQNLRNLPMTAVWFLVCGPLPMLTIFTPVNTYLWTLSLNMWNEFIIISFGISRGIISVRISPQFNAHSSHIVSISCQLNVSCSNEWKANSQPLIYPWILCNSILFKHLLNM